MVFIDGSAAAVANNGNAAEKDGKAHAAPPIARLPLLPWHPRLAPVFPRHFDSGRPSRLFRELLLLIGSPTRNRSDLFPKVRLLHRAHSRLLRLLGLRRWNR